MRTRPRISKLRHGKVEGLRLGNMARSDPLRVSTIQRKQAIIESSWKIEESLKSVNEEDLSDGVIRRRSVISKNKVRMVVVVELKSKQ